MDRWGAVAPGQGEWELSAVPLDSQREAAALATVGEGGEHELGPWPGDTFSVSLPSPKLHHLKPSHLRLVLFPKPS